jgi:ribosomal protein L11 methylase PrmA
LQAHIHLHAVAQKRYAGKEIKQAAQERKMSKMAFTGLISSLETTVKGLSWKPEGTEWADYYSGTNYTDSAFNQKRDLVEELLLIAKPESVWDLGANTGVFSRLAGNKGIPTVSFDIDPAAVEINYLETRKNNEKFILPLILDLTNPSPAIGWANQERASLEQRAKADLILALALIHHMAISNNVPLTQLAEYFVKLAPKLIIEFVPKDDSQVQRLLVSREDIFPDYNKDGFEHAFNTCFRIVKSLPIPETKRILYLMERR